MSCHTQFNQPKLCNHLGPPWKQDAGMIGVKNSTNRRMPPLLTLSLTHQETAKKGEGPSPKHKQHIKILIYTEIYIVVMFGEYVPAKLYELLS